MPQQASSTEAPGGTSRIHRFIASSPRRSPLTCSGERSARYSRPIFRYASSMASQTPINRESRSGRSFCRQPAVGEGPVFPQPLAGTGLGIAGPLDRQHERTEFAVAHGPGIQPAEDFRKVPAEPGAAHEMYVVASAEVVLRVI